MSMTFMPYSMHLWHCDFILITCWKISRNKKEKFPYSMSIDTHWFVASWSFLQWWIFINHFFPNLSQCNEIVDIDHLLCEALNYKRTFFYILSLNLFSEKMYQINVFFPSGDPSLYEMQFCSIDAKVFENLGKILGNFT